MHLLQQSIGLGLAVMIIGLIVMWLSKILFPKKNLNTFSSHAVCLFIVGVALAVLAQPLGLRGMYCK